MARPSVAANLAKILKVQAGLAAGLSPAQACKQAGTSAGSHKQALERYAALLPVMASVPCSRSGIGALSPGGRFLFMVDEDLEGITLCRRATADGTQVRLRLARPRGVYDRRLFVAAAASEAGDRFVFVSSVGLLLSWTPGDDDLVPCLDLGAQRTLASGGAEAGGRNWSYCVFSPDLSEVVCWGEPSTLHVFGLEDGVEHQRHAIPQSSSILPEVGIHPRRPLLATLGDDKRIHVWNYQTGETVVDRGPEGNSVSFGPGDTLLCVDAYGRTVEYDYSSGTQRSGWGARGSQSSRFLTLHYQEEIHLRDSTDLGGCHALPMGYIRSCQLSDTGEYLVAQTDHVTLWRVDALLQG